jgi:hypothetical protein
LQMSTPTWYTYPNSQKPLNCKCQVHPHDNTTRRQKVNYLKQIMYFFSIR